MEKWVVLFSIVYLCLFNAPSSCAAQNLEMTPHYSANYGLKLLYPKSWELQIETQELLLCEYEIRIRPPSWQSIIESSEYRRDDFPIVILICEKDFESLATSYLYEKTDDGWISVSKGIDLETDEINGKGWTGIVGEVPFRSVTKTGEPGGVLFLQQAILSINSGRSAVIIMEYMDSPWDVWDIDALLHSLEITQ